MFDPVFVIVSEKIKTKAVFIRFAYLKQAILQHCPLGGINIAFENGILHAYPKIQTRFRHTPQTAFSSQINRAHIVTHKNKHKN